MSPFFFRYRACPCVLSQFPLGRTTPGCPFLISLCWPRNTSGCSRRFRYILSPPFFRRRILFLRGRNTVFFFLRTRGIVSESILVFAGGQPVSPLLSRLISLLLFFSSSRRKDPFFPQKPVVSAGPPFAFNHRVRFLFGKQHTIFPPG